MAEREHFTNGRCFAGGTGLALTLAALSAQISGWMHWISIGIGYGSGISLMVLASIWISKSYYLFQANGDTQPTLALGQGTRTGTDAVLRDRVFTLAKDVHVFLRDLPSVEPLPTGPLSDTERWDAVWSRDNGRVEKVNHGYAHRFRDRVITISHELAENGISLEAKHFELDPPEIQRENSLRNIEEALLKVVVKLDLDSEA